MSTRSQDFPDGPGAEVNRADPFQQQAKTYHQVAARQDLADSMADTARLLRRMAERCDATAQSVRADGDVSQIHEVVDSLIRSINGWHVQVLLDSLVRFYRQSDGGDAA